jgi:flagellar L-ring protein precursor FlgH
LASVTALLLTCAISFGQVVRSEDNEGSLVPQKYHNPSKDLVAGSVGDLLTIVVNESSSASLSATTKATKTDSNTVPLLSAFSIPILGKFLNAAQQGANSSVSGDGSTVQAGAFTAKIAVIVKEVLPNGNLVIEGERAVKVNKDLQIYKLSGIIRRADVRIDNTVLSENVANAQITTDGKGLIGDRQRRGILTRLVDWLF